MTTIINNPKVGWVSARHLQHFIAKGDAAGLPVEDWLAAGGLSRAQLEDGDGMVSLATIEMLLALVLKQHGDPLLGLHMANNMQPANLGALGYVFQSCNTLADALDVLVRFNGLLSNISESSVIFLPGVVEVRWTCKAGGPLFRRHATEYVMAAALNVMRTVLVEPIQLRSIHFAHERLDATDRARQFFNIFQCPVYFGRNHNAFFIPVEALKLKLKHGDAFIKDMMEHRANELLKKRQESVALTDEVARLIAMMILDGVPTRDMVAEQLGMSGRSLHRKLQQIDSSYQKIFDSVRWEMAKEKLLEGDESLNKIAGFLSFGSHQAFLRWFKQMTGMNPGEFRKKNGGLKWIE